MRFLTLPPTASIVSDQGRDAGVHTAGEEPANDLYQFNLAVLRIRSSAPEKSDEARKVLERLKGILPYPGRLAPRPSQRRHPAQRSPARGLARPGFADEPAGHLYRLPPLPGVLPEARREKVFRAARKSEAGGGAQSTRSRPPHGLAEQKRARRRGPEVDGEVAVGNDDQPAARDRDCRCVRRSEKLVAAPALDPQRGVGRFRISAARLSGLQFEASAPDFVGRGICFPLAFGRAGRGGSDRSRN